MVSGNAKSIGGRKRGDIRFSIRKFIQRSGKCRFEQAAVAKAVGPAKKRELLGMEVEDEIDVEPLRLIHFASAL
jgi:hypothetical protein